LLWQRNRLSLLSFRLALSIPVTHGAETVAEISKTDIESGITTIQHVLGTHLAEEIHLLSATHNDGRNRQLPPKPHHHASECARCGRLNDSPMPAEPGLFYQSLCRERVDEHRRALFHVPCLLSGTHNCAEVTRYSAHMPPAMFGSAAAQATRRPLRNRGIIPLPASTTVPLPSNPGIAGRGFLKP
jgi:hypothetical protein